MSDEEKKQAKKAPAKKAATKTSDDNKAAPKKAAAKKSDDAKVTPKAEKNPAEKKSAELKAEKKAAPKREKKAESGVKKQGKLIDNIALYDVIERPVITEKSTWAAEQNKVVFKINPTATKKDVKAAVEALFGVKVTKVNTILTKGKTKKFRGRTGVRSDARKAIVTLAEGQSIDIAAGLK